LSNCVIESLRNLDLSVDSPEVSNAFDVQSPNYKITQLLNS